MKKITEKNLLIIFGQKIKVLRNDRSMSQEDLADSANVHRTYIGMIERGEKNITLITLSRLAVALNIDISEIVKGLKHGK